MFYWILKYFIKHDQAAFDNDLLATHPHSIFYLVDWLNFAVEHCYEKNVDI